MDRAPAMTKLRFGVMIAAMAIFVLGYTDCSKSPDDHCSVQVNRHAEPVTLELTFPTAEVSHARRLLATIRLTNVSTVPVWLNRRMSFNDEVAPAPLREVWIRVRRHDGTAVKTKCVGKSLPATDSDYWSLPPGQSVSTDINVSCLDLAPGDYQLIARFADRNEHPPFPPGGAVPFVDHEIQSSIVALKVD